MTRKPLRSVTTSLMLVLVVALAACEMTSNGSGSATNTRSSYDRSGASSDYGSPSLNDE